MQVKELNQPLLLIRPKPLPDELLSSWVVRLAWMNGQFLTRFVTKHLSLPHDPWHLDIDRGNYEALLSSLAHRTGIPFDMILETTFRSYEDSLFKQCQLLGGWKWITPVGCHDQSRKLHGQQYCVACLLEDSIPYFRKKWRLSFITICTKHNIHLHDSCLTCHSPVSFHEASYKNRILAEELPNTICPYCKKDYRNSSRTIPSNFSVQLLTLQKALEQVVDHNFPLLKEYHPNSAYQFFSGFHPILRLLCSNKSGGIRLRAEILKNTHRESMNIHHRSKLKPRFEALRQKERSQTIELAADLIIDWPSRFITYCRSANLQLSDLFEFHETYPSWLSEAAHLLRK